MPSPVELLRRLVGPMRDEKAIVHADIATFRAGASAPDSLTKIIADARAFLAEHDAAPVAECYMNFYQRDGEWGVHTIAGINGPTCRVVRIAVPRSVYAPESIDAEVTDA